jgi:predicted alpha/beta superfamily hydrolase
MKRIILAGINCLIIVFCLLSVPAVAQQRPTKDSLYSEILKEQRRLQVILPENYNPANKYDVIYAVDGEWHTDFISQVQQQMISFGFMPANIIVGIHNTYKNGVNYRDRDLTPSYNAMQALSGHADNFLSFIKKELIPWVNKTYSTTGKNSLFGASHGGTFTMFALLTEPTLFDSYIAADPSFWWDNGFMSKLAAEKLPSLAGMHKTLHICGRLGDAYEGMGIVRMDSVLKTKAPEGIVWKCIPYPDETHNSTKYKSIYDGLKFAYAGYSSDKIVFHPMNGILVKDSTARIFLESENSYVRYTTDGTDPGISSAKMKSVTTLAGPAVLKAKIVSVRANSEVTIGNFKEGVPLPSTTKPKKAKPGGVNYFYYEGEWDKLPDFKKLTPVQSGIADKDFNLSKFPRQSNFACVFEGYLEIERDGHYVFGIGSDDGTRLYLSNQLLIDNDGIHNNRNDKTFLLPLKKGFYPIRLEYFRKKGNFLRLMYLTPGANEPISIPPVLQYSN